MIKITDIYAKITTEFYNRIARISLKLILDIRYIL
jgi:hypothetical protein